MDNLDPSRKHRIVVGLSGGVDSAVSALLLARAGHEVVGVFMKNWEDDDRPVASSDTRLPAPSDDPYCSSNADFVDAAAVADVIGIEIEHVNFAADYKDRVFAAFLHEYRAGRTPNPDVLCNAEIKFKAFVDHALRLGADAIATGHYARTRRLPSGEVQLLRGLDAGKDQSYFLHRLTQDQLARVLFPVGALPKREVRRIAAEAGLPNAGKRDSTGICFIGERPFREFLSRYLSHEPGDIVDERGRKLGAHVGLSFYTLGQRQGLGVGGVKGRADPSGRHAAWYVAAKDLPRNRLVVVQGHDHPLLAAVSLDAIDASWIAGAPPPEGTYGVKTRYRQADGPARLDVGSDKRFSLDFGAQPQWAATPGQSAVLYDAEVCLGGGVIDAVRVLTNDEAHVASHAALDAAR